MKGIFDPFTAPFANVRSGEAFFEHRRSPFISPPPQPLPFFATHHVAVFSRRCLCNRLTP
ncbi:uncharacterized protein G2W53_013478 [Senna tora]|uniref:Uncharacterized protein n=1 Tax=Senna tora TaxID=362788 RepID=A0A834U2G6_9FABA|nr:uncharacterized protein G2W53_013478 [Senna tora]